MRLTSSIAPLVVCSLALFAAPAEPLNARSPVTAVAIAPDGTRVVAASQHGLHIYNWPELRLQSSHAQLPWPNVHDIAFSNDGELLAIAGGVPSELGGVAILKWPGLNIVERIDMYDDVAYQVAWSGNGEWLATCSADHQAAIINRSGKRDSLVRLNGHSRPVTAVTIVSDRDRASSLVVTAGVDQSLRVWGSDGKLLRSLENHTAPITDLATRPATSDVQAMIASCGEDATVRFWQPSIGRLVRFIRLPSVPNCMAWTHDGGQLVVGCRDGRVRVIDPVEVAVEGEYQVWSGWIYAIATDHQGERAIVGGEGGRIETVNLRALPAEE